MEKDFLRIKVYEAFFESAPQFALQIYIILTSGRYDWIQICTITTSLISVISTSVNVYLKMPLAYGKNQHVDWRNIIFVLPAISIIVPSRMLAMALISSMLKPWGIIALSGIYVISLLWHLMALKKKSLEDDLMGIYCSFFSSCIVKSIRSWFLVTTCLAPITGMISILSAILVAIYSPWTYYGTILLTFLHENDSIFICTPHSNMSEQLLPTCFEDLDASIIRCPSNFQSCNHCSTNLCSNIGTNVTVKTYCKSQKTEIAYTPSIEKILIILVILLFLSMILTLWLKWYLNPKNRLWITIRFPFIKEVWEPSVTNFHYAARLGNLRKLRGYHRKYLELPSPCGKFCCKQYFNMKL